MFYTTTRKFGQQLKEIRFGQTGDYSGKRSPMIPSIIEFLHYCPNLLKIDTEDQSQVIRVKDKHYLPKLEILPHFEIGWHEEDVESLRILTEKYSESLKDLQLTDAGCYLWGDLATKRSLSYIRSLVNLEKLELSIDFESNDRNDQWNASDYIKRLSKNCRKIKDLTFKLSGWYFGNFRNLFESFSKFTSIGKMDIAVSIAIAMEIQPLIEWKSKCFRHCTNLKHVILSNSQISDKFFVDIDQHTPHLRSIDMKTDEQLTDRSLISLSKLTKLKKVSLVLGRVMVANQFITDDGVCQLINGCTRIEQIWFDSTVDITNTTIEALKTIAIQRPRIMIEFGVSEIRVRDDPLFDIENLSNNLKLNLPN